MFEIFVYGRVQGLGFRKKIEEYCAKNSFKGFVENRDDGSVYLFLDADKENLEKFLIWLKSDFGLIKINNFYFKEIKSKEKHDNFYVKRKSNFIFDEIISKVNLLKYFLGMSFPRNYLSNIPKHIAIIPDGNRRWARRLGLNESEGHKRSAEIEKIKSLLNECKNLGVNCFSIWGFSTENWKRDENEKKTVFDIISNVLKNLSGDFHENKIRFRHFGRKDRLPKDLIKLIDKTEKETKTYEDFNLNLLLDYGGRDEIIRAFKKIVKNKNKNIDEKEFSKYLDSYGVPDPDLIIRTSGENRTSGFMPFQSVYSELYFEKKFFPEFNDKDLRKAVLYFNKRERRLGR